MRTPWDAFAMEIRQAMAWDGACMVIFFDSRTGNNVIFEMDMVVGG